MGGRLSIVTYIVLCLGACATPARAINILIDDTYDTNGFFAAGSQARAALDAAADYYSAILDDTFSQIVTPEPLVSSLPPEYNPGTAQWQWTMSFAHPSSATTVTITNSSIAADEYRLYVGAKILADPTLGQGGPGGNSVHPSTDGGNFSPEEAEEFYERDAQFKAQVSRRGEVSGFARWGGFATFDLDSEWHFDHTTAPPAGKNDLFSVAIHEIGHALGLGGSDEWTALTAGAGDEAYFFGQTAVDEYGTVVPLAFDVVDEVPVVDDGHWREGTMSHVFGSNTVQEAAMDPTITVGSRKRLTALDAAALTDIGWTVVPPPLNLPGDYNDDKTVDAADYTVWRNNFGNPESLPNDDSPGVDDDDYDRWKSNFGSVANPGSGSSAHESPAVPEPSGGLLAVAGILVLLHLRESLLIARRDYNCQQAALIRGRSSNLADVEPHSCFRVVPCDAA
jgi:hypothetical protein